MSESIAITKAPPMKPLEALKLMRQEVEAMSGYWTERMSTLAALADEAIAAGEIRAGEQLPKAQREAFLEAARDIYAVPSDNDIEIDDDAEFSATEDGSWVSGWLYVRNADAKICPECGLTKIEITAINPVCESCEEQH